MPRARGRQSTTRFPAQQQQKPEVLLPAPETPQTPPPPPAPVPSSTDAGGTATTTATTDNSNSATATQTLIPPAAPLAPATTGNATSNTSSTDTASTAPAATATSGTGATGTGTTGAGTTTADAGTPTGTDTTQPAAGTDTGAAANTGSVTTTPATDAAVDLYGVPTLAPTSGTTSGTTTVASADTTSTTAPASSVADNFRIQLAALKSEAEANKTWKRILSKHSDVLGSADRAYREGRSRHSGHLLPGPGGAVRRQGFGRRSLRPAEIGRAAMPREALSRAHDSIRGRNSFRPSKLARNSHGDRRGVGGCAVAIRQEASRRRWQPIGEACRRRGRPAQLNPKGRANLPACCVSRLARWAPIALRRLPGLLPNSPRRHRDPREKCGLA